MKSILTLFFCVSSFLGYAQKVHAVKYANQADLRIFVVAYENQADLKIYFVNYENQAGWKNNSKQHLLY